MTLLQQYGDLADVHICSMGKVASRCPEKATFHKLDGTGMAPQFMENWEKNYPGDRPGEFVFLGSED